MDTPLIRLSNHNLFARANVRRRKKKKRNCFLLTARSLWSAPPDKTQTTSRQGDLQRGVCAQMLPFCLLSALPSRYTRHGPAASLQWNYCLRSTLAVWTPAAADNNHRRLFSFSLK
ncbi:unnamed protein product, partial [Ectocarpus sp. 12 AP-2014]